MGPIPSSFLSPLMNYFLSADMDLLFFLLLFSFEFFSFFFQFIYFKILFYPLSLEKGFKVLVNGKEAVSRGVVLTGSMDSPAKADVQGFTHHNGKYGCSFCLNPGVNVSTESKKNSTVHVYKALDYPYRTQESTIASAKEAHHTGDTVPIFTFLFQLLLSLYPTSVRLSFSLSHERFLVSDIHPSSWRDTPSFGRSPSTICTLFVWGWRRN